MIREVVEKESLIAATTGAAWEVLVDENYLGTMNLRINYMKVVLGQERADEVRIRYKELRINVSTLFSTTHSNHDKLVWELLVNLLA